MIEFVFMLTSGDVTVPDALDQLRGLEGTGLRYVGYKDVGATPELLRTLTEEAHALGMETMLEVVSVTRDDEVRSLEAAAAAGLDWVLGGTHPDDGERIVGSRARYCPFPGRIEGHPSVLLGSEMEIAADAAALTARPGVHGVDLLAYRHPTLDVPSLVRAVVAASAGPVIAAGSVETAGQIRALDAAGAWGFTIGSAIFAGRLPGAPSVADQVRGVLEVAAG